LSPDRSRQEELHENNVLPVRLGPAFVANQAVYTQLLTTLVPAVPALQLGVGGVVSQATYAPFLTAAHTLSTH